jgi:CelD/BcsL family acetyltransferase involved in cellulose biosynthesis
MIADQTKKNIAEAPAIAEEPIMSEKGIIKMEVFDSFEAIASMEPEWDALAEAMDSEISLTFDWCRIWWKHYGKKRKLRIYTFRSDGALVGLVPVFFEHIWFWPAHVKVVKLIGSDFTIAQLSLPVKRAFLPMVMEQFLAHAFSAFEWDIIFLGPLSGQYSDLTDLYQICCQLCSKRQQVEMKGDKVQTYFELSPSWEKYLRKLDKKERHEVERTYKLLARTLNSQDKISVNFAKADNLDHMFTNFVQMHQSQWNRIGRLGHFGDWPVAEAFHREIAHAHLTHDRLRLMEVTVGRHSLGYEYIYKCGKKYINYLAARSLDKELAGISLGKITIGEMVKYAIGEGINCIDSLQGRYEYKLRLGGKLFPIHKIFITKPELGASFRVCMFRSLARLLNVLYYKIWFCRVAMKLPFGRRPLRRIWIRTRDLI